MSRDRATARDRDPAPADEPSTRRNVLIGAGVALVTAPLLPLAPLCGGGVAGYLERSDLAGGARVGALSGGVAAVQVFLIAWFVVSFLFVGFAPFFAISTVFAVAIAGVVAAYLVVAGALGGAAGAYLRRER
ncbi:DUF5518 domain-containing protein [Halorussus marinus]|uniref:DUF5518 domain-containing protein n=1 Tax=Halorussus marinus TaxID=2505976 RepID=UPI0010918F98|nr:DUF5518 domain-containing protein [Halorussus marinus]